jgi:RluA family pseudouridine synthase
VPHASPRDPALLYRDARFAAVDKPPGWLVVPGRGARRDEPTLVRWLAATLGVARVWVVHRLDADTSGVVLLALDADAHRVATAAFAERRVEKRYLAFVRGCPDRPEGRVTAALAPDPTRRGRGGTVAAEDGAGRPAVTDWRLLQPLPQLAAALVAAWPRTGRTHQIRVHLAGLGHPVLQDERYGALDPALPLRRLGLHAERLAIPALALEVAAPLPADLAALLGP